MGVGFQGREIRLEGGEEAFDGLVKCRLVFLGCEQVIGARFQDQGACGFGLGVQGIQHDQSALQIQAFAELASHRDFVGLGIDHRAAQIKLAGHADGGEHALAAAMVGFFAVH